MTAISEELSDKRVSDERLELMLESIVPANTGGDLNLYNANDARLPFKSDTLTRALRELQSLRSGNGGEVRVVTDEVRSFLYAILGADTWLEAGAIWEQNPEHRKAAHEALMRGSGDTP